MELKISNLTKKHVKNTLWPKEKKIQVVAQWLALGNMRLVSATTGVNYDLIRTWKGQPWWAEYEREIRNTENLQMDSKLSAIVERSLEAVQDRLENGEHFLNNKTGEIQRKPVNMKDAAKVANDLLTKRELLRGNATSRTEAQAIPMAEQLKLLAAEFAKMNNPSKDVIDVEMVEVLRNDTDILEDLDDALPDQREEELQKRGREIHESAGSDQETLGPECGESGNDEAREGL